MQVLSTILYILLFLVFLSILIIVHELGHLAMAKAFNVYCLEYSIGMGPLIFKKKRKNGETQFSLRAIPFGGYVSMYGEGVELPEGVEIPESRSLNGIKWWKRGIILLAGVTMNAILAIVFFFISNILPQQQLGYINQINVDKKSSAYAAGLRSDEIVRFDEWQYYDSTSKNQILYYVADEQAIFDDDESNKYAIAFDFSTLESFKHLDYSEFAYYFDMKPSQEIVDDFYEVKYSDGSSFKFLTNFHTDIENPKITYTKDKTIVVNNIDTHIVDIYSSDTVSIESVTKLEKGETLFPYIGYAYNTFNFDHATFHFTKRIPGEGDKLVDGDVVSFNVTSNEGILAPFGVSIDTLTVQRNFGQAFVQTFKDFGTSSVTLVQAIGDLVTKPKAWENVGGIVAVGFQTTGVLQNLGFARFLYVWGFISVNLAIFNLLPFPGLDGWQLLVLIIETTTRKKIPEKVKNIVSLIGIFLLLLLMGVIVVKDLITYVF